MQNVKSDSANVQRSNKLSTTQIEHHGDSAHTDNIVTNSTINHTSKVTRVADSGGDEQQGNTTKLSNRKGNDLQTKTASVTYALASDPFLVQQAIAFFYLYSIKFAYVSDARHIVNS